MENVNEEKSLVKVDNGIFSKIRRFFHNIFSKNNVVEYVNESREDNKASDVQSKDNEHTQPKLFNYDNPQNYYEVDNTVSDKNVDSNEIDKYNEVQPKLQNEENSADDSFEDHTDNNAENENSQLMQQEYIGISKYFDDVDENYIGKSKRPKREDGYEGKEELEQKLMNYYASIKNSIQ